MRTKIQRTKKCQCETSRFLGVFGVLQCLLLFQSATTAYAVPGFRRLSPPDDGQCLPEGVEVRYECTVEDASGFVSTVWLGSAFSCPDDQDRIAILHSDFATSQSGMCGALIVETSPPVGTEYTSTLTVTTSRDLNGTKIRCTISASAEVGNDTLLIGVTPSAPENMSVTFPEPGVRFTLNWAAPSTVIGGIRGYQVISTGDQCGNCGGTVDSSTLEMSCTGWLANGQICRYTVQTISDDCGFLSSASEVNIFMGAHAVLDINAQLVCSDSLIIPGVQVNWTYNSPPPLSSLDLPQLLAITLNTAGAVEDMTSIPTQNRSYSGTLSATGDYRFTITTQNDAGNNTSGPIDSSMISFREVTSTVDTSDTCLNISFSSDCMENAGDFEAVLSYTLGSCPVSGSPTTERSTFSTTGDTYSTCVPLVTENICYSAVVNYQGTQVAAPVVNEELVLVDCDNSGLTVGGAMPNVTSAASPHGTIVTFSCSGINSLSGVKETRCNNGTYIPVITTFSHNCNVAVGFIVLFVIIAILVFGLGMFVAILIGYLIGRKSKDSDRTQPDQAVYDEIIEPKPIELSENKAYGPLKHHHQTAGSRQTTIDTAEYEDPSQMMMGGRGREGPIETSGNVAYGHLRK